MFEAKNIRVLLIFLLLLVCSSIKAQQVMLYIHGVDSGLIWRQSFEHLEEARQIAQDTFKSIQQRGYYAASVDSLSEQDTALHYFIYFGERYQWQDIKTDSLPETLAQMADKYLADARKNKQEINIEVLSKSLLRQADHQGFPFAQVCLDEVRLEDGGLLSGRLKYRAGSEYRLDSIRIHYEGNLSPSFLYNYLEIKPGMRYSGKKMNTISPLIAALPYLQEERPWELKFGVNYNGLDLYLKQKRANQANAIIGLQPSANEEKRFDLTADVLLFLQNEFGYGEQLRFSYQQLQANSPRMNAALTWPFLMGTRFGIDGIFDYQRFDTTFRKTLGNVGVRYQFTALDFIQIFTEFQGNRVITFDTAYVRLNKKLPPNTDLRSNGAGLMVQLDRQDNPLNPYRGFFLNANIAAMSRKILPNTAVDLLNDAGGFDYRSLYPTQEASLQTRVKLQLAYYQPIWQALTLKLAYEGAYLSGDSLFRNELFQLGGFKLLRGFNELSIFSSHYHVGSIEPRILVGPASNVFVFTDMAYIHTLDLNNAFVGMPALSLGVGGTLSTESGIFNIAIAVGKQGEESFAFRNARVHFGYAVYF